jgi:hypothetical protein
MKHNHFQVVCCLLICMAPLWQGVGAYSDIIPIHATQQDRNQQDVAAKLKPRKTSFCDVVSHPEKSDQQLIRTRAILVQNLLDIVDGGETYLYAPSCRDSDRWVLVEYDQSYDTNSQIQRTLEKYVSQDNNRGVGRAEIEFIGRFDKAKEVGFGHLGAGRYRFVIINIENVKPVPKGIPWPKQTY